ncbi:hypothetical protein JOQ06_011136 [Pogonophryne albipinna]|uniref:Ig-like domain-containing protein n=1 Tax=Pogonophryne albipinna TaxID=1090488 RepID=A0AAD6AXT6_9TELE|nr:hypothetical protein JOQ06_011136 [Pogonophryne albipinna]
MINTLTLLLVALSLPCCTCQSRESIPSSSVVKRPGETLSLSCRGSGFTLSCCSALDQTTCWKSTGMDGSCLRRCK